MAPRAKAPAQAAPGRRVKARETQLAFEALSIEGGLLSPEWLARAAQLDAGQQTEADYRVPKGLALRDEIGRYWRIAQAHWADFQAGLTAKAEPQALAERFAAAFLKEVFGFASLQKAAPVELEGRTFPVGNQALAGRVPVVIAPAGSGLDALAPAFGDGGRRRSAFGLAQEYLNAQQGVLWGIATDGLTLRLLRDNASLTRPAWIEADLARMFGEERYADFAALWLIAHESRFGDADHAPSDCPLERWRAAGREEGTRAREHLRTGVEEALVALGRGFLVHSDNQPLRTALQGGELTREAYFQELLRLVYRLIFLLTAEERGLLHPEGTADRVRALYEQGYGLRRLRDRAVKRSAHDRFGDLWEGLKIVLRGVAEGEPRLGLPALGGLFAADQCPHLDAAKLENRALLTAVFRLSWLKEAAGLSRVNWRDMGPEELGSVYESLLELVPIIPENGRGFAFATGDETKGNARKTTGSYYTPDSLVQVLLDSALEPVVKETIARNPEDPAEALLRLSVVDPACGSGHFLLAAGRRLAVHVARLQVGGTPSAAEYRHALRQVVSRCLFGVDLNPMAVELCRVSLWMEAVEPGRPLSFLDSHIQRGNALLGATPELMKRGIPDAAFEPIEGDDKKTASLLKKRNKEVAEKQGLFDTLWSKEAGSETDQVTRAVAELDAAPDADLAAVAGKEARWEQLQASDAFCHQKFVADAWCAAFVWPKPEIESAAGGKQKKASPIVEAAPTNALWLQIQSGKGQAPALTVKTVEELADQYNFFHWHLAFPQVFARGGFDVVLGNPPWDKMQLEEQQFFAGTHPHIAMADARRRKELIADLETDDQAAFARYRDALRAILGSVHLIKGCKQFPLASRGNVSTHAVFLELALAVARPELPAAVALVLPSGLASQDSQKDMFAFLVDGRLRVLFDFENSEGIFPAVHRSFRFAVVVAGKARVAAPARFSFFLRTAEELREPGRVLGVNAEYLKAVSPNTSSCPLARTQRDLDILLRLSRSGAPLNPDEGENHWRAESTQMFNETHEASAMASGFDQARPSDLDRLYEAKLIHQFDHRFASYVSQAETSPMGDAEHGDPTMQARTRWLVPRSIWDDRIAARMGGRSWTIGFRRITRATDERTFIAAVMPRAAAASATPVLVSELPASALALLLANLNSFAFDFGARLRNGGIHLDHFIVKQLSVIKPSTYESPQWSGFARVMRLGVLELSYTAWDVEPFGRDIGYEGPPFRWDPERRFLLRAELDAAFFHLYGISRDDTDYILETFPIVRKNDEKAHGEYRTKRVILEIYDEMAEAIRTGKPYQTRLDPPPADARCAHPGRRSDAQPKRGGR